MAAGRQGRVIRVDREVFAELRERAQPGETANNCLRRVFGLEPLQERRSSLLRPWGDEEEEEAAA